MRATLNIESLLQPVKADEPAGPNLDGSLVFRELEQAAVGRAERQMGDTILPGEPPDWSAVMQKAIALLEKTKDLRVATHLTRGLLETQGFAGLADGLHLVRELITRYWVEFHPQREEEDNDATARITAMTSLAHREMVQAIRSAPLVRSRAFGAISLRSIEGAASTKPGEGSSAGASVEGAFQSMELPDLAAAAQETDRCAAEAKQIEEAWNERLGEGGPDFSDLRRIVIRANDTLKARLGQRQGASGSAAPAEAEGPGHGGTLGPASPRAELRSREDVVRAIDGICGYYAQNEPSSPVPLLLKRCRRLVTMSFLDIVKDMVPDGLPTIETIAGKQADPTE